MATKDSVKKAWDKAVGHSEFKVVEEADKNGSVHYNVVSKNGSVAASASSLEALEKHAGEPFVEAPADVTKDAEAVEIDNTDKKKAWNQESTVTRDQLVDGQPDEQGGPVVTQNDGEGDDEGVSDDAGDDKDDTPKE